MWLRSAEMALDNRDSTAPSEHPMASAISPSLRSS
jgi:hypothetical protein